MKKHIPLGSGVLVKVECCEIKSSGGIIIAAEGTRESMAREECEILALGEDAFTDLNIRPKVGDKVIIARYDGKLLEEHKDKGFDLRVIQDNRVLTILREEE